MAPRGPTPGRTTGIAGQALEPAPVPFRLPPDATARHK